MEHEAKKMELLSDLEIAAVIFGASRGSIVINLMKQCGMTRDDATELAELKLREVGARIDKATEMAMREQGLSI